MTLGERIKEVREQKGLSLNGLAEKVGVTKQAVFGYERGITIPSAITLGFLADALECSADYLLGRK